MQAACGPRANPPAIALLPDFASRAFDFDKVDVTIDWPQGTMETFKDVRANQWIVTPERDSPLLPNSRHV
jgi:hypothetical protein